MNLETFLEFIADSGRGCATFRVVAGPWPVDDESDPAFETEIMDIYADDVAQDIIFLLSDAPENLATKRKALTMEELERQLISLSDGRLEHSVEFGYSLPEGWRYDLPVHGSVIKEEKDLYVLCWKR